jgi:hypothetical protein
MKPQSARRETGILCVLKKEYSMQGKKTAMLEEEQA